MLSLDRNATYLTKTLWSFNPLPTTSFFPQYGDDLLPNNALDDIRDGNFHNVSILVGVLSDEGSFILSTEHPDEFGFFGEKDPKINKTYAKTLLESTFSNYTDPKKYIDFYLKDISDKDYDLIRRQVYTAFGDTNILCPTVYFAESYAERNNDVFYYFFIHRPSDTLWAEWMGVVHFEEVQFVFGRPLEAIHSIWMKKVYSTKEVWLSKEMMEIWANFAKDGRPAHPDMYPKWKKYTKESHSYLTIDIKNYGKHGTGPHLKNCNFLRDHFGFSSKE
ncbi:Acetylcholinesterase-1 [Araneus ventricosus]|uniref:Acetylcholinesterase-1 n=1 Tax=Araneus ventricosus TaxID=182803 RepID=A0A4Y2RTZ9_ARAVE|nr:Acetylcholinesterase-1 [Araneus ventricosus]